MRSFCAIKITCNTYIPLGSSESRTRWYCVPCSDTELGLSPGRWCLASRLSVPCLSYCCGSPESSTYSLRPPWPRKRHSYMSTGWQMLTLLVKASPCTSRGSQTIPWPHRFPPAAMGPTCSAHYGHKRQWQPDPPVVHIIDTRSSRHLLGSHPGQSYIPREVGCPLKILDFVHS